MQRILLIYFFITLNVATFAQELSKQDEQFVDSVMNANYIPNEPGAVLLIAKNGKPIYRKGYGLANLEFNVSNKPEYVFPINSMTKQFTAVCILQLAQAGKLNLQDDITKYLPAYNTHGRHITIENLLNHTSGIEDFPEKKEFPALSMLNQSHEKLLNSFMNDSLVFEPGKDWGYSNSGYAVAAMVVEKVSGISMSEYLQQNIFDPLGMSHSSTGTYDSLVVNAVYGYTGAGNGKFKPAGYTSWSWQYGAGGILSNVDDLLKWDNALYTENIIKKEWLEKAWTPVILPDGQATYYGLGWTINNFQGLQFIEHAGGGIGFSSDAIRIPSQQLYLVVLSNKPLWLVPLLSCIALRITGQTITKSSAYKVNEKAMEDYTGVYSMNHSYYAIPHDSGEQRYLNFISKNDTLFVQYPGAIGALLNVSKDLFTDANGPQYYQFHRNEKGILISVEIYITPVQNGPHDINLKTDLPLPKEIQGITLDIKKLELLKGKYDFGGAFILPVTVEGNKIYMPNPDGEKEEIFAEDETHFFSKKADIKIEFIMDNGKATGMSIHVQGQNLEGKKIE